MVEVADLPTNPSNTVFVVYIKANRIYFKAFISGGGHKSFCLYRLQTSLIGVRLTLHFCDKGGSGSLVPGGIVQSMISPQSPI